MLTRIVVRQLMRPAHSGQVGGSLDRVVVPGCQSARMMLGRHGVPQVVVLCEYSIRIKRIPDRVPHFFEWVKWSLC
jgi:hypothetical protein